MKERKGGPFMKHRVLVGKIIQKYTVFY